jgi:hypothetical protein
MNYISWDIINMANQEQDNIIIIETILYHILSYFKNILNKSHVVIIILHY